MSTKRKKNSRNPSRPNNIRFIKIYDDDKNPWGIPYYMCGMCGHAVAAKDVETHAGKVHNAISITLLEVDDTPLSEEEAAELGKTGHDLAMDESKHGV